ncbi:hypothetical protein CPC08DRAFT_816599 [Agrocybe pediades]|nr:hypothetical protein CPC08DRAFT_816599 [Agrocybe pediades]
MAATTTFTHLLLENKATTREILWEDDDEYDDSGVFSARSRPSIGDARRTVTSIIAASQQYALNMSMNDKQQRKISGNKRVARYRETQGYNPGTLSSGGDISSVEVFQSITAKPGLQHVSFEELRCECYLQSLIATKNTPQPVDPQWPNVFPPLFNAHKVVTLEEEEESADFWLSEVIMSDP